MKFDLRQEKCYHTTQLKKLRHLALDSFYFLGGGVGGRGRGGVVLNQNIAIVKRSIQFIFYFLISP